MKAAFKAVVEAAEAKKLKKEKKKLKKEKKARKKKKRSDSDAAEEESPDRKRKRVKKSGVEVWFWPKHWHHYCWEMSVGLKSCSGDVEGASG